MGGEATDKFTRNGVTLGHLGRDISFVSRVLRAWLLEHHAKVLATHDLAGGQVALLNLIAQNPGISQKQLADVVVLKKSALTKAINEMEAAALIERRKEGGDQRYNALYLSDTGTARVAALREDIEASQEHLMGALDPEERELFFSYLWRLIDSYEARS